MIVLASGLIAAGQWVGAQAPVTPPAGGGNTGGGTTKPGGGSGTGGGNNSARKVTPNNGYKKGVANYGVNTITIGGQSQRTIQPKIMVQDFTKKGMRILLRSKRWGGETYPY